MQFPGRLAQLIGVSISIMLPKGVWPGSNSRVMAYDELTVGKEAMSLDTFQRLILSEELKS